MSAGVRAALLALGVALGGGAAAADRPGEFDYWVLALSWSPQYCAQHEAEPQCLGPRHTFVVHGLWPQYERGYPDYCSSKDKPSHELVERMLPLMPDPKLVSAEWRKHGTCSGLSPEDYFLTVERARRVLATPPAIEAAEDMIHTSAGELAQGFIQANPGLTREAIGLECSGHWFKEAHVCFDKDFRFRACGEDVANDCGDEVVVRPNRRPR